MPLVCILMPVTQRRKEKHCADESQAWEGEGEKVAFDGNRDTDACGWGEVVTGASGRSPSRCFYSLRIINRKLNHWLRGQKKGWY